MKIGLVSWKASCLRTNKLSLSGFYYALNISKGLGWLVAFGIITIMTGEPLAIGPFHVSPLKYAIIHP